MPAVAMTTIITARMVTAMAITTTIIDGAICPTRRATGFTASR